jgi:glyceraldehyde-3-phosphate dehydrogenase/erythrose-4-phosphate dehydrogenase
MNVGINGFGSIGRLVIRAFWGPARHRAGAR